ncbi:MAG: phosphotransferase family protein [Micromonosporaceae bacterium]
MGADAELWRGLAALGSRYGAGAPVPLSQRPDGLVVGVGRVVVKAHPDGTDPGLLARRLRVAVASPELLLAPLPLPDGALTGEVADRVVTVWPAGQPVDPDDPAAAPWEAAARLLAGLHTAPVPAGTPPHGAPARLTRALTRLDRYAGDVPEAGTVRAAYRSLPGWVRGEAPAPAGRPYGLVHGDWHLGQLVQVAASGWRLVDVDDLGGGDPVWDLARPAAWYATGLMPAPAWRRFVDSYRADGGPALPRHGDPWDATLDAVARALTVQIGALAVVAAVRQRRGLDEVERSVLDSCRRIAAESGAVTSPVDVT